MLGLGAWTEGCDEEFMRETIADMRVTCGSKTAETRRFHSFFEQNGQPGGRRRGERQPITWC
jgi:hypothetical protein